MKYLYLDFQSNPTYAVHEHPLKSGFYSILETNMIFLVEISFPWTTHTMIFHIVENVRITITTDALIC